MVSDRRSDDGDKQDKNGRIIMRVPISDGPSWNEIWKRHVMANWRKRDEPAPQKPLPFAGTLRRLPHLRNP